MCFVTGIIRGRSFYSYWYGELYIFKFCNQIFSKYLSLSLQCTCALCSYLIDKRHGSQMLEKTIWLWNHTSHTRVYFDEFVANALRDNMGMIIFDLRGCGGCWRPITSYLGTHFGTLTQRSVHPSASVMLTKYLPRNEISYDFQTPISLHISNSRTKPAGLDF